MSKSSGSAAGDVFDLKKIRQLVELMKEHDLGEVDLAQGEQRIRLRRGVEVPVASAALPRLRPPKLRRPLPSAPPAEDTTHLAMIKSPMVGTFYTSASPDVAAFVKIGDHVGPDSTVCIVEAMKVFNEIPAEVSGKIVAVLVQNGDPVEYGQPLFKVDTSQ